MTARAPAIVIRPADSAWANAGAHLRRLSEYGELLWTLSMHRINIRNPQTRLGVLWAVLQPLLMMTIFTIVFSRLAGIPSDGLPYALFVYVALLPWTFFSAAVTTGAGSLVDQTQLITRVYFPREILPLTCVLAALVGLAAGLAALVALITWFQAPVTMAMLYLVPLVILLAAWALAVALVCSAANVRWRDLGFALPVLLQLWMFVSPVVYPLSAVPAGWRPLYLLNPLAGIITAFRDVVLRGQPPEAGPLGSAAVVTACALPVAYLFFKRSDATMADVV